MSKAFVDSRNNKINMVTDNNYKDKFVNVSLKSDSELGHMLAPGFPVRINTIFGTAGNVRAALDFVTTPGFPIDILSKKKFYRNEVKRIPTKKVNVPNFQAIQAYIIAERIMNDEELVKLLKENDKSFTSYNEETTTSALGGSAVVFKPNTKMGNYIAVIRDYEKMIKEDNFNIDTIKEYVINMKLDPEAHLFQDVPFNIEEPDWMKVDHPDKLSDTAVKNKEKTVGVEEPVPEDGSKEEV